MSVAPLTFEFIRRDVIMAIRCTDSVTGLAVRGPVELAADGLSGFRKPDGIFIVTAAGEGPLDVKVTPGGQTLAPRRALLQRPAVPASGGPDPRIGAAEISLLPALNYRAGGNAAAFVCRVLRTSDHALVSNVLVRLFQQGVAIPRAAAVTGVTGEAMVVLPALPLINTSEPTTSRSFPFRLEATVIRRPVAGERMRGAPGFLSERLALEALRVSGAWPDDTPDPDLLAEAAADTARSITVNQNIRLIAGRINPAITLELPIPD
jgi:hypothetical protein